MSSFLATIAALLTIFGAGFGATLLLLRNVKQIAAAELTALSWLLGAGVISMSLWLIGMPLRGVSLHIAVVLIALGLALTGVAIFRNRKMEVRIPWPRGWFEYALGLFLCLEIATVLLLTFQHTLGWDGLLIWELKARYAYLNGGALPVQYFSDASRVFSHPEYPLFLPMLETWIYFWIGDCDQYWVKLIFPLFYAVGMILLAQAGASWSGKRWIGLLAANLFLFIPFLTRVAGGIVFGYADVPFSIVYLGAFYFLSIFVRQNSKAAWSCFLALAAILPWIKREGIVLWFVVIACGAWTVWRRRGIFPALLSFLPGLCVITGWQIFLKTMHASPAQDFDSITLARLCANLYRLGPILGSLLSEAGTIEHWNLLWWATSLAFLCLFFFRGRDSGAIMLVICTVAPIAFYSGVYLFSGWSDYQHHVRSSLPRLLLDVAPLAMLAIASALGPPRRNLTDPVLTS
jgi:hypothetical protein